MRLWNRGAIVRQEGEKVRALLHTLPMDREAFGLIHGDFELDLSRSQPDHEWHARVCRWHRQAIVSTPYVHAVEVLSEGRGLLAEFRDSASIGRCLQLLLDDPDRRLELEARMAAYGKEDSWPLVGCRYAELFHRVVANDLLTGFLAVQPDPIALGSRDYHSGEQ